MKDLNYQALYQRNIYAGKLRKIYNDRYLNNAQENRSSPENFLPKNVAMHFNVTFEQFCTIVKGVPDEQFLKYGKSVSLSPHKLKQAMNFLGCVYWPTKAKKVLNIINTRVIKIYHFDETFAVTKCIADVIDRNVCEEKYPDVWTKRKTIDIIEEIEKEEEKKKQKKEEEQKEEHKDDATFTKSKKMRFKSSLGLSLIHI